jgi:hypothetical protein
VSIAAHVLVTCYSVYIGQDFYDADEERKVVQAADFLIKKEQSFTAERRVEK